MATRVQRLVRSPALRIALGYGVSGVAFLVANLLLARELTPSAYGLLALLLAVINLAAPLGPLGADGIVNRVLTRSSPRLLARGLSTSIVVATVTLGTVHLVYDDRTIPALVIGAAVIGGGINQLASAQFQAREEFWTALGLSQCMNVALLLAALASMFLGLHSADLLVGLLAAAYWTSAAVGWSILLHREDPPSQQTTVDWAEALAYAGVTAAVLVLLQLERLVIPKVLSLEELATFGVIASIAGGPFRMLQQGLGFTLLPRLREADGPGENRRVLKGELIPVSAILAVGSALLLAFGPDFVEWFFDGKYHVTEALVAAIILVGFVKVTDQCGKAAVTALAQSRHLQIYNGLSWLAVLGGLLGAVLGSRWGLTGVVLGAGAGWLLRAGAGVRLARPNFRGESSRREGPDRRTPVPNSSDGGCSS